MNGSTNNLTSFPKSIVLGIKELKNTRLSSLRKVFSLMGKNEKIAVWVLTALAILSFAWSTQNFYIHHTVPAPTFGGSFSEGMVGQPLYINPLLASQEPDNSLVKLVFSGLYKYDANGQLIPDLADGMPQISDDQKQYTVNLKKNAVFHNGKALTADDVIFTVQTLQDPSFKSPLRPLWTDTTVQKVSDNSVRFINGNVSGPFVNNLTLPILPKGLWQDVDASKFLLSENNLKAVGSGPYKIAEIKKLPSGKIEQITLSSNQNFYFGRPKIDEIIVKFYDTEDDVVNAFHSREILAFGYTPLGSSVNLDKDQNQATVLNIPLPQYQVVFFNLGNKILNDINVRQALTLSTNKQTVIDAVFKGNANLPNSPFVFNDPKNPQPISSSVDLNKAKSLLDQAGWVIDPKTNLRSKKNLPLAITISTNDSQVNSQAAQNLIKQWKDLNIQVSLNILPSKELMENVIKPRNFDVLLFPQKFGADPDPFLFWHSSQIKNPGFNLTGFANAQADKLIVDARNSTNHAQRQTLYQQFNDLVLSQFPVIFLDQTKFVYVLDNSIKNVSIASLYEPNQRFYNIENWYMAEKRVWKK